MTEVMLNRLGRASASGGDEFDLQLGHTKEFKNGSNGCLPWHSGFFGVSITTDWLINAGNISRKCCEITEEWLKAA